MPPPEPLLSEQAAFSQHLFIQGYPLWNPDPASLPPDLQRVGLRIGDVGTVDERGGFDVFFNILHPHPGSADTPSSLPQINESMVRCSGEDILPRVVISSPKTSWELESVDSEVITGVTREVTMYSASLSRDGAHIILPQGAHSFELGLRHRRLFENYAREHGTKWLELYQDRLGWPRSNSVYLLTGFYKSCSWAIASFGMEPAASTNPVGIYCRLMEADEYIIRDHSAWCPTGRFNCKIGPPPNRQGQMNQTNFIRGFTITPNPNISQTAQGSWQARFLGVSANSRFLSTLLGSSVRATETEPPPSNVTIQHVPHVSHALHPSEIINQYLLIKEEPHAKIAVTHDSQWVGMLKVLKKEGQSWTLEYLADQLEALVQMRYHIATQNDAVYLTDRETIGSEFDAEQSKLTIDPETQFNMGSDRLTNPPGDRLPGATDLPSSSKSSYKLSYSSLPDDDMQIEAHDPTELISSSSPNMSIHNLDPAWSTYLPWVDRLLTPMDPSAIEVDTSSNPQSSITSESETDSEDSNPPMDRIIQEFHSSRKGEPMSSNASQPVDREVLGEMREFLTYNQNWSTKDMLEFNKFVIDELEVICQWWNNGTICLHQMKSKDLKVHLHDMHGIASDSGGYQCQWGACGATRPMMIAGLVKHIRESHLPARWACPYCDQTYLRHAALLAHIERRHEYASA